MKEMLYKKYRPSDFNNFFGNRHVVTTIKNSILRDRLAHAYLFTGPRGTGKTSMARLIAKSVSCLNLKDNFNPCSECSNCIAISKGNFPDLIEMDAASNRGIDEIRELKDRVNYQSLVGKYKVYIVDEVHMLTKEAFNALLKTLEEPPKHVIFILATTEIEKVPDTIISRCQTHNLKLLDRSSIVERLKHVLSSENRSLDREALDLLISESGHSMRDAITLLEKILTSYPEKEIVRRDIEESFGLVSSDISNNFYSLYTQKDLSSMLNVVDDAWTKGYKIDSLFKGLADNIKKRAMEDENVFNNQIDVVSTIYSSLNEFRLEENKRAVGYVISNRIVKLSEVKVDKIKEKAEQKVEEKKITEEKSVEKIEIKDKEEIIEKETEKKVEEEIENNLEIRIEDDNRVKKLEDINLDKGKNELVKENREESEKNLEDLKDIDIVWKDILNRAKDVKISLMLFLTSAKPIFSGNTLTVLYDLEHTFHKESLEKRDNILMFGDIVNKILGRDVKVVVQFAEIKQVEKKFSDRVSSFLEEVN